MSLDDVVVFVTVAELGSFSSAARKLGTTRVAVTRAIASLEKVLGTRLLVRTTRRVSITAAGAAFLERVGASIANLSGALHEFSNRDAEPVGRLRVGTSADVAALSLAPTFVRFVERYPGVTLDLQQASDLGSLAGQAVDVLLGFSRQSSDFGLRNFNARYVGATDCWLYAAPSYLAVRGTPEHPRDLSGHTQISPPLIDALERSSAVDVLGVCPEHRISCADVLLAQELIRLGCGLGFRPRALVEADLEHGRLVPILGGEGQARLHLWLLASEGPYLSRASGAFYEFVSSDLKARRLVVA